MKLQKTLPQNAAFYERYADLIHSLTKVATISQVVTGATEIGILYALLSKAFSDILPPQYIAFCAMIGAVFCAALLQIGLKKVFPYSVCALLFKRFKGLDLAITIGVFILTVALLVVSVFLSWSGAKDIADFAIQSPTTKTTDKADSLKAADVAIAQRVFSSDSATIETKFKGKVEAIQSEYQSRIAEIERYSNGKQATSMRAELKTKLAKLDSDKATEIEAKASIRQQAFDRAESRNSNETATITTDNGEAKAKAKQKQDRYGSYIGYFTAFCYVFFLCVFALNEIYHKGANIEIKPLPSQRHFSPSVIALFIETVKEKTDVFFRTKIQAFADKTAAQPLPSAVSALYDFKADVLTDTVKVETKAKETKVIKLPLKLPFIPGIAATAEIVTEPSEKRQIGFNKTKPKDDSQADDKDNQRNASIRNAYESNETSKYTILNCAYEVCGKPFERRTTFQKYCCEDHRIAAFEYRTGRQLKKQPKK
jgi:hypothetical protein